MSTQDQNPFNYPFRSMTDFADEFYRPKQGRQLAPQPLGLGPTLDVAVAGEVVLTLSGASMVLLDAATLKVLGRLDGLVSARQVSTQGGIAFVTARESGCYVVDIRDPAAPRLLAQYDPVEFATGVHMPHPGLAILTNRHFGLEFVDLSSPAAPRFLSSILIGEAQSVTSQGTVAYAGVWFEKELVLVDFADPARPEILGRSALDGFGDGVRVRDGLAYIAAGHHSAKTRDPRNFELARHITPDMLDAGYGGGHGVEIHDVSDPANPHCVARIKSPPGFVSSPDTWRVHLHGDILIHADAENGVFLHDATDPVAPRPLAFAVLPAFPNYRPLKTVPMQEDRFPATGIAVAGNRLLIASAASDLYACDLPTLPALAEAPPKSPFPADYPDPDTPTPAGGDEILGSSGQIHWVATDGEVLYVAAGADGLYVLDRDSFQVIAHQPIPGLAQHVFAARSLIYVSGVTGGLTIWQRQGSRLARVGAGEGGPSLRQVMIPETLPFGIAVSGPGSFEILDLADPAAPVRVASHRVAGNVYARLLADGPALGRYGIGASQGGGINWFDLTSGDAAPVSPGARLCPIAEGICVHDGQALVFQAGGWFQARPDDLRPHSEMQHIREPGRYFSGNPQSLGAGRIAVTNRATGSARILDVSDPGHPRTLAYLHLPGHPDRPIRIGNRLVFPCGYSGLRAVPCP